jgi:hypothetical protein
MVEALKRKKEAETAGRRSSLMTRRDARPTDRLRERIASIDWWDKKAGAGERVFVRLHLS